MDLIAGSWLGNRVGANHQLLQEKEFIMEMTKTSL